MKKVCTVRAVRAFHNSLFLLILLPPNFTTKCFMITKMRDYVAINTKKTYFGTPFRLTYFAVNSSFHFSTSI